MQSFVLDFDKSPSFWHDWNKKFCIDDFDSDEFKVVLVDDICKDNISECLTNGILKYKDNTDNILEASCNLKYTESDDYDDLYIQLDGDVVFTLESDFSLKGLFIVNQDYYVMGASINTYSVNIATELTIEDGLYLWSLIERNVIT